MSYNYIFVGLGNIGDKYAKTRHNVGWMLMEKIAEKYKLTFRQGKGDYYYSDARIAGKKIMFVLPTTYMNNSGIAVKQILNKHNQKVSDVCIFVDEYNFPIGKIHVKATGSDGGHNGTSSMISELNSNEFMRLRLGIDKKFGPGELVDYVLNNFTEEEKIEVDNMLSNALKSVEHIIKAGFQRAMSEINSGKLFNEE